MRVAKEDMSDTADIAESTARDPVRQPILNPPYQKPQLHWHLDPKTLRATNKLMEGRRKSGDYLPVPKDKKGQYLLPVDATSQIEPHISINAIRGFVDQWRDEGWPGTKSATFQLLDYWTTKSDGERPFFCQIEAIETIIWLLEAGRSRARDAWSETIKKLKETNAKYNEGIPRLALKMATGTGKTKLMQMLITWLAATRRNGVDVLVMVPGLTVRERLQELVPSANSSAYDDLAPQHLRDKVNNVRVTILNYHAFQQRDVLAVAGPDDKLAGTGKKLLARGGKHPEKWKETPSVMLGRLLKSHGKRKLFVFNDEAHHCYRPSTQAEGKPDAEEKHYEEDAALWFNALRYIQAQHQLEHVFDLSATPMFLRRPAELNSVIFPWTVSDYPLIDAVEAGLTKIPRVPTDDDADSLDTVYRNVYINTTPKDIDSDNVQGTITTLLEQMHEHYEKMEAAYARVDRTPVMIVVANTVKNATALYRHIAGYRDSNCIWHRGAYEAFSNVEWDGSGPKTNAPTLLVHSALDQAEDLPANLAAVLSQQAEIHAPDTKSKKDFLKFIRKVFNTVGDKGQPGEFIRCVISVSMLTEGWDTRTVTHIFGYRKFGTQLLCEQVAGRGLRRTNFETKDTGGLLNPEFVNIFGIPFNFMRAEGETEFIDSLDPYDVYSIQERARAFRIAFPNVVSYLIEEPALRLCLDNNKVRQYDTITKLIPTMTEVMGALGETHVTELTEKRRKHVIYKLAAQVVAHFRKGHADARRLQLFGSAVDAVKQWLAHPLVSCSDLRQLMIEPHISNVPAAIVKCCHLIDFQEIKIVPVFADQLDTHHDRCQDTGNIAFSTTKRWFHDTVRSELNRAPCDSRSEVLVARALDSLDGIAAWARNYRLGWKIPYLDKQRGVWRNYEPDFVAKLKSINPDSDPVYLVIEYKGQPGPDSHAKLEGIQEWWIPAVSGSDDPCCRGTWRYVFIDSESTIANRLTEAIERI